MIWWYVLAFFGGMVCGFMMMALMAGSKNNDREFVRMYKDKETDKVVYIKHSLGVDLEVRDAAELETLYADDKPIMYVEKQREQMGTDEK
jgi:hypothetical protein